MVVVVTVAVISILTAVLVVIFFVKGTETRKRRGRWASDRIGNNLVYDTKNVDLHGTTLSHAICL